LVVPRSNWPGDLAAVPTVQLGLLTEKNAMEQRVRDSRVLQLAATWADRHEPPVGSPYGPTVERACCYGGDGTPEVAEFCAGEFAALQGVSFSVGRAIIADALDLRHRLPKLWTQVVAGQVRAWTAQRVAQATRPLAWAAAGDVDDAIAGLVEAVPWPRFERILLAAILEADPVLAAQRAKRARPERCVWASQGEDGLKMLVARADAGDLTWFMAAVNRLADILAARGDTDPLGARRAQAVGWLARPAEALALLSSHSQDPDRHGRDPDAEGEAASPEDPEVAAEKAHTSLDVRGPFGVADLTRGRPRVVLNFHLSDAALSEGGGLVRPEHSDPLTMDQLRTWLAPTGCRVHVRAVVVPRHLEPVDGYEIPHRIRFATRLREVAEIWPFGSCTAAAMDLDHTERYLAPDDGGPPGQTGIGTLGPLSRTVHRSATFGRWRDGSPTPGRTCGGHPTAGSTWSPTTAPCRSPAPGTATPSGGPPGHPAAG